MIQNKLVLITGAGRGIGRAIALEMARNGAQVVVAARSLDQTAQVAQELSSTFATESLPVSCDVANLESVQNCFAAVLAQFGRKPDILVNSAGVAESSPLVKITAAHWQRHIDVNLTGTFYCMREALPAMIAVGWGRIINVASIAGKTGGAYVAAYSASKHGVLGLTRSVALEVAQMGITVNALCPGYVDTEMADNAIESIVNATGRSHIEARAYLEQTNPQGRLITVEEVAAVALLLASEAGRGINGQAINIDGGAVMN